VEMGESKLGNGTSSWILYMATIILTANFWGFYLKEWTGVSKKTFNTFLISNGLILASIVIVGAGCSRSQRVNGIFDGVKNRINPVESVKFNFVPIN
jgi:hypothetical protein